MHGDLEFSLRYDVETPCVEMIWRGYATSAAFREANERVLVEIAARRARKLLCDVTDFVLIGAEDQDWLNADWIPRAVEAGVRVCALVTPNFYFNRVAVETVSRRIDSERLNVGYFDSRDAARAWLKGA